MECFLGAIELDLGARTHLLGSKGKEAKVFGLIDFKRCVNISIQTFGDRMEGGAQ